MSWSLDNSFLSFGVIKSIRKGYCKMRTAFYQPWSSVASLWKRETKNKKTFQSASSSGLRDGKKLRCSSKLRLYKLDKDLFIIA